MICQLLRLASWQVLIVPFVAWLDGSFVLLHPFVKKTQKTPRREIEKAKRELQDLKERGLRDEE